jgi:hypothetical protein
MFSVKNVPVVIEPGVGALEAEFFVTDEKVGNRAFPVQLQRVPLDQTTFNQLPFVPATQYPHVFSLTNDLDKSAVLVIYDLLGRIATVYTRGDKDAAWERNDVAEEHAGKTVTQFSVRFNFSSVKDRTKFLELVSDLVQQVTKKQKPTMENVTAALGLLARSRVPPVVLPVAVAKAQLSSVKL